jgi:hypothetical protein
MSARMALTSDFQNLLQDESKGFRMREAHPPPGGGIGKSGRQGEDT